jgi:hypothetical protein
MRATLFHGTTVLAVVLLSEVLLPSPVSADAVVDWNAIAAQAALTAAVPPRPGPSAVLDFAMVHAAVYDAVEAIDKRFQPYRVTIPGASGSPAAAAAKAAHDVLVNRFPAQASSLDTAYNDYLSNNGLAANDPGVAVGQQAAAGIIALRANDGSFPTPRRSLRAATTPANGARRSRISPGRPPASRRWLPHGWPPSCPSP